MALIKKTVKKLVKKTKTLKAKKVKAKLNIPIALSVESSNLEEGKEYSLNELQSELNIYVELPTLHLKAVESKYIDKNGVERHCYTEARLFSSKKIFILQLNKIGKDETYPLFDMRYKEKPSGEERVLYVNKTMKVKILSQAETKQFHETAVKEMKANLEKSLTHNFMSGSDPEFFFEDEKGNNIPAFDFLPNKINGIPGYSGTHIYWDGFQAEFTVAAAGCLQGMTSGFAANMSTMFKELQAKHPKATLSAKTVIDLSADTLANTKPEHLELGCAPSENAYGMQGNFADGKSLRFRPAGGHMHFGIGVRNKNKAMVTSMVKMLDKALGVACVSMFASYDDPRRRELYGLAGEYRLPAHGLEYRTLSNAWTFHPVIMNLCFDFARTAIVMAEKGLESSWDATEEETVRCINTCDVKLAREILKRNQVTMIKMLKNRYTQSKQAELAFDVFYKGMESVIKDPKNVAGNWGLDGKKTTQFYYWVNAFSQSKKIS